MKPKFLVILTQCIEEGCRYGVSRAHKHTEDPSYEQIEEAVESAIMERIHSFFEFPSNRIRILTLMNTPETDKFFATFADGEAAPSHAE